MKTYKKNTGGGGVMMNKQKEKRIENNQNEHWDFDDICVFV